MGVARSQRRNESPEPSRSGQRKSPVPRHSNGNGKRQGSAGANQPPMLDGVSQSLNTIKPITFTITSDYQGREVQDRILADVQRCGYDDQSTFAIKISLEEALINAIKHGNKRDPAKKVFVQAKITPKRAEIVIEDEGPGFARETVPDPTAEENLCKCSGRGILLMETYMNSVKWTKNGRRVKMIRINQRHLEG